MIPWWGWLIIAGAGAVAFYYFVVLVIIGVVFSKVFKDE